MQSSAPEAEVDGRPAQAHVGRRSGQRTAAAVVFEESIDTLRQKDGI